MIEYIKKNKLISNLIIIVIALILFYICSKTCEGLTNINIEKRRPEILDDKLFNDIVTYDNDIDGRLGLDKCLEQCQGKCVEYGISGVAQCFPPSMVPQNEITINKTTADSIADFENESRDRSSYEIRTTNV